MSSSRKMSTSTSRRRFSLFGDDAILAVRKALLLDYKNSYGTADEAIDETQLTNDLRLLLAGNPKIYGVSEVVQDVKENIYIIFKSQGLEDDSNIRMCKFNNFFLKAKIFIRKDNTSPAEMPSSLEQYHALYKISQAQGRILYNHITKPQDKSILVLDIEEEPAKSRFCCCF